MYFSGLKEIRLEDLSFGYGLNYLFYGDPARRPLLCLWLKLPLLRRSG
jgi:hypothetical protein